jgi:hypothetical protein
MDLQRIVADLIERCQGDLDAERKAAAAEMETVLCVGRARPPCVC